MAAPEGSSSRRDFKPTDVELLQLFLYSKVHGKPLPNYGTILEYDLFGDKNPWEIWDEFGGSHSYDGRDLYFFTLLKRKRKFANSTGSRSVRTIGLGSWEGEDSGKTILANNTNQPQPQPLGTRKRYRFEKSGTDQDGRWILHEFSLDASLLSSTDPLGNDYVLCRFRKNLRFGLQNTGTRNTGQARQRRTNIVPELAPITQTDNNVLLGENIHQGPRNQPHVGDNRTEVVETITRAESEYKEEENGAGNSRQEETWVTGQRRSIVLALPVTTKSDNYDVLLGKDIYQGPRNQPENNGDNKTEVVETTIKTECEHDEEEDGLNNMSWVEQFSSELKAGGGYLPEEEEEVQLLPNPFARDLLLEKIDIKYMKNL